MGRLTTLLCFQQRRRHGGDETLRAVMVHGAAEHAPPSEEPDYGGLAMFGYWLFRLQGKVGVFTNRVVFVDISCSSRTRC